MKIIAFATSWLLYYAGHCVSMIMHRGEVFGCLYAVYNKLMCWSFAVQEYASNDSPWRRNDDDA